MKANLGPDYKRPNSPLLYGESKQSQHAATHIVVPIRFELAGAASASMDVSAVIKAYLEALARTIEKVAVLL